MHARLRTALARFVLASAICLFAGLAFFVSRSHAYIEAAMSFGAVIAQSSNVLLMRVESVDKQKNIIIYRKIQDIKGKHPTDIIKHNIGTGGLRPGEWKPQMEWAEPGKVAAFFYNGGASETCIGNWWYQAYAGGEWWNHSHGEPFLLRSYCGPPEKLVSIVTQVMEGKEVAVPCMVDGNKEDLHNRRAKIQRLKVSLKLQDYNPKRDFLGWGGEDFRRVAGMPGFTHIAALPRVDPDASSIAVADFDGDGKLDLCLAGGGRVCILQNTGESLNESTLTGVAGGKSAAWGDYNGDGKLDLLLATPSGLRLFTNLDGGKFRDDSHVLPPDARLGALAAVWLDFDGDGRPDVVSAHGYHGLRYFRNIGASAPAPPKAPRLGKWSVAGPLANNFDAPLPWGNAAVDVAKPLDGLNGQKVAWKPGEFADGSINNLRIFPVNDNASCYLHREIESPGPAALPIRLGSDDSIKVWLNGEAILANNSARACEADQERVTLKLKPGKNDLVLRIGQGSGDWAFYFRADDSQLDQPRDLAFADLSTSVGFGPGGVACDSKFDTLVTADLNGDGKTDLLHGNAAILHWKNDRFAEMVNTGLDFDPRGVSPAIADFDGDGHLDIFVPQKEGCKLFKGDGACNFRDVTSTAGDLAKFSGWATSAAWADIDHDGSLDLVVGCLRGPNRLFLNKGKAGFVDASESIGLTQRIFNTQGVQLADINSDGAIDMILTNLGQDSVILLGAPPTAERMPLLVTLASKDSAVGSRVDLLGKDGRLVGSQHVSGGDGRGGQSSHQARFTVAPGEYQVRLTLSSGQVRNTPVTVGATPTRAKLNDSAPKTK